MRRIEAPTFWRKPSATATPVSKVTAPILDSTDSKMNRSLLVPVVRSLIADGYSLKQIGGAYDTSVSVHYRVCAFVHD
jgi:hypothetical protein